MYNKLQMDAQLGWAGRPGGEQESADGVESVRSLFSQKSKQCLRSVGGLGRQSPEARSANGQASGGDGR